MPFSRRDITLKHMRAEHESRFIYVDMITFTVGHMPASHAHAIYHG